MKTDAGSLKLPAYVRDMQGGSYIVRVEFSLSVDLLFSLLSASSKWTGWVWEISNSGLRLQENY